MPQTQNGRCRFLFNSEEEEAAYAEDDDCSATAVRVTVVVVVVVNISEESSRNIVWGGGFQVLNFLCGGLLRKKTEGKNCCLKSHFFVCWLCLNASKKQKQTSRERMDKRLQATASAAGNDPTTNIEDP